MITLERSPRAPDPFLGNGMLYRSSGEKLTTHNEGTKYDKFQKYRPFYLISRVILTAMELMDDKKNMNLA
jgi:hypothetical protein